MELEIWFKKNGSRYEALRGRQPDLKHIFHRADNHKPKIIITKNNLLKLWGSAIILDITHINDVKTPLLWDSHGDFYYCTLTGDELEDILDFSKKKKLKHLLFGTPKPKITNHDHTNNGTVYDPHNDRVVYEVQSAREGEIRGRKAFNSRLTGDMYYSPQSMYDQNLFDQYQDSITDVNKLRESVKRDASTIDMSIKPSDGSDQPVAPKLIQKHTALKEIPVIEWHTMSDGVLQGDLKLYNSRFDITLKDEHPEPGKEVIYVRAQLPDELIKLHDPDQATVDLCGYSLAIEGSIIPPLETYIETDQGKDSNDETIKSPNYLCSIISIETADAIRLRLGGRTRAELQQLHELKKNNQWDEWHKLKEETKRDRPAALET